ncbi:MAG: hypothetical protein IT210_14910 [Armatimonadetes bacterium]|nr:hypothetical protein [Armatimonadota bacterium]
MRQRPAAAGAAVLMMAGFLLMAGGAFGKQSPYVQGDRVSDVALKDVNGKRIKLSQFKGRPILINFFAHW